MEYGNLPSKGTSMPTLSLLVTVMLSVAVIKRPLD